VRVRIVGSFDGTQLSYSPAAPPLAPTTINAYETVVFTATSSFVVTGDKPFAVAEFLMSNEAVTVDPTPQDPDDNFFVGDPAARLGFALEAANLDGDPFADLLVSPRRDGSSGVDVYDGDTLGDSDPEPDPLALPGTLGGFEVD